MESSKPNTKIFVSYSHKDKDYVEEFRKHAITLEDNFNAKIWIDKHMVPGDGFEREISKNIDDSDIFCLFLSANYLSSTACKEEYNRAIELSKQSKKVISIVLDSCPWTDYEPLRKKLALPTDAKPVTKHESQADAWLDVVSNLKRVISKYEHHRDLETSEEFDKTLQDAQLLSKAHPKKEVVLLDDIFCYPHLDCYDESEDKINRIDSYSLIENFDYEMRLVIGGENQSGRTSLARTYFKDLFNSGEWIPVLISGVNLQGDLAKQIKKQLQQQYSNIDLELVDDSKIVPLIDDFHLIRNKAKYLAELETYSSCIIFVNGVFELNILEETSYNEYERFKIREFGSSLRDKLIRSWNSLSQRDNLNLDSTETYKDLDNRTEIINTALGNYFGTGIMPSYPFFILSVLSSHESLDRPIDQEISSQGHCYQSLIYIHLRKIGISNDDFDTYLNFLTEFSHELYKNPKRKLSADEFIEFKENYEEKYNLSMDIKDLVYTLQKSSLMVSDSCGDAYFCHEYLYYYFVAKYFAENYKDSEKELEALFDNLHTDENSYIIIFISYHSKDSVILQKIISMSETLYKIVNPATLNKDELSFFDDVRNLIVDATLDSSMTTEQHRKRSLEIQDEIEDSEIPDNVSIEDVDGAIELRKAIKAIEIMGQIMKNRSGSLERAKLEEIFEKSLLLGFKLMNSFIIGIQDEDEQIRIENFITKQIEIIAEQKDADLNSADVEKFSKRIFWNINFFTIYGFIEKLAHSLGSTKLLKIAKTVCDDIDSPASYLVKNAILMWYAKSFQHRDLIEKIKSKNNFSEIAKQIITFEMIVHCALHPIRHEIKLEIANKLKISRGDLRARSI